jgi:hypothetical protein
MMNPNVRRVQELRRSSAAGPQDHAPSRQAAALEREIAEQIEDASDEGLAPA